MVKSKLGVGRSVRWRSLLIAACAGFATLWTSTARATITQGDFSVFGFFESREEGRWGEGSAKDDGRPATYAGPIQTSAGRAAGESGGSFDFNHWDLDEMRQLGDIRPDYHIVKNYKFLGRFDTLVLKDADFFAFYRPWYDAFGTLKNIGRAEPNRDASEATYTQRQIQEHYMENDLHEYYAQLNFTDNFSVRIGKQEVIWSEADAYSGTEITNPQNLKYHFIDFESAENIRTNLRMIKFNYILPDFLKTANNELEAFVIPGDYEGDSAVVELDDARDPWIIEAPVSSNTGYNREGQLFRWQTFADQAAFPSACVGCVRGASGVLFQDDSNATSGFGGSITGNHTYEDPIKNSEFGVRYSSLLPIGNGLQASFIFLYEARLSQTSLCGRCPTPIDRIGGVNTTIKAFPGIFILPVHLDFGPPPAGDPVPSGTERVFTYDNTRRNPFFGLTGTYYDKDLTDVVYRYDTLYAPRVGINVAALDQVGDTRSIRLGPTEGSGRWTEESRFILAGDRPTYIPWISKQHTFLVAQWTGTWYPDLPGSALQNIANANGKLRRWDDTLLFASTNWLVNGQLTSTNAFLWDADDIDGFLSSTNVYRYSRNVLFGINAQWYLGRSGRYTDIASGVFSRAQRQNELEATFQYEI
jgi:hypothetical protein